MRIDVFTIFPELVDSFSTVSLLGKARDTGSLDLRCHDIRDEAVGTHIEVWMMLLMEAGKEWFLSLNLSLK